MNKAIVLCSCWWWCYLSGFIVTKSHLNLFPWPLTVAGCRLPTLLFDCFHFILLLFSFFSWKKYYLFWMCSLLVVFGIVELDKKYVWEDGWWFHELMNNEHVHGYSNQINFYEYFWYVAWSLSRRAEWKRNNDQIDFSSFSVETTKITIAITIIFVVVIEISQ